MRKWSLCRVKGTAFGLIPLLLSITLRILVPTGWMPAGDGLHIRPCAVATAPVLEHHSAPGRHGGTLPVRSHGDSCAFTSFAVPLLPPAAAWIVYAPIPATSWITAGISLNLAANRGLAAPPPPQTGPPLAA